MSGSDQLLTLLAFILFRLHIFERFNGQYKSKTQNTNVKLLNLTVAKSPDLLSCINRDKMSEHTFKMTYMKKKSIDIRFKTYHAFLYGIKDLIKEILDIF